MAASFCACQAAANEATGEQDDAAEAAANRRVAVAFYKALAAGDAGGVRGLLASTDLEWWFHGPACDQHLMHFLTGAVASMSFLFTPLRVRPLGCNVFVEGIGAPGTPHHDKVWVHVWTVKQGKIVQLREYFNTSLTVLKPSSHYAPNDPLWQSQLPKRSRTSIPSLILAM